MDISRGPPNDQNLPTVHLRSDLYLYIYIYIYIYSPLMGHLRDDSRVSDSSYEATPKITRRSDRLASRGPVSSHIVAVNAYVALPTNRLASW